MNTESRAASFREFLEAVVRERRARLGVCKGNFGIHVPGLATWTVVTSGKNMGVHDGMLENVHLAFCMMCPEGLLEAFMDGGDFDLEGPLADGTLELVGDVSVFVRF